MTDEPIPGKCIHCGTSIQWARKTPLTCQACLPKHEKEKNELARFVARAKVKEALLKGKK